MVMDVFWRQLCERKGDLFVLSCARVLRVRQGSIELIMCSGGVRSIFYCLLWIDA